MPTDADLRKAEEIVDNKDLHLYPRRFAIELIVSALSSLRTELIAKAENVERIIGPDICSCHPRCKVCREQMNYNAGRQAVIDALKK